MMKKDVSYMNSKQGQHLGRCGKDPATWLMEAEGPVPSSSGRDRLLMLMLLRLQSLRSLVLVGQIHCQTRRLGTCIVLFAGCGLFFVKLVKTAYFHMLSYHTCLLSLAETIPKHGTKVE